MVIKGVNRIGMVNLYIVDINEKLIEENSCTFVQLNESDIVLYFDPPLKVSWSIYENKSHPLGPVTIAYIIFDFGLEYEINPVSTKNNGWGYQGINPNSTNDMVIKSVIIYDLFHAFTHFQGDPNYTHLHWALYGNLKDRIKVIENFN